MSDFDFTIRDTSIIGRAIHEIPGFKNVMLQLKKRMINNETSSSTFKNYIRHIAAISLHFQKHPGKITIKEVDEYLYQIKINNAAPSPAFFKFTVFGLRYMYYALNMQRKRIKLPTMKHTRKLPVVLSTNEMKRMLKCKLIDKHRILIGLLYECGLRCLEVRKLELIDIDFDRKTIYIRNSKGNKERLVPMGETLCKQLKIYIQKNKPEKWLFNKRGSTIIDVESGGDFDRRFSQRGVGWAVKAIARKAGITKNVSVHTLRHTFATHLLESGVNIVMIQKLMGHVDIKTTLIYLQISDYGKYEKLSLLDNLLQKKKVEAK